jgi:hypothetical protein
VAFHDALNAVEGPIRVFTEEVLQSDRFGPSGFVHSIAWSQFRPRNGSAFRASRKALQKLAARLVPFVSGDQESRGLRKIAYKLNRSRVPRKMVVPEEWVELTANGN